jgi:dipeptidyl aminopeptidase/acylaminoacyl peptidase
MTNWLITQYPDRFAAAITGAGITNWISDYGTADIYRTKETEFFGTPWDKDARERMINQSPLTFAGNVGRYVRLNCTSLGGATDFTAYAIVGVTGVTG